MKYALCQISSKLGHFEENAKKIIHFISKAKQKKIDLLIFPEMALCGYSPKDLLRRDYFVKDQLKYLEKIHKKIPEKMHVFLGLITLNQNKTGKKYYNSIAYLRKNKKVQFFHKTLIPYYGIFEENRHFSSFEFMEKKIISIKNKKCFISVCEDLWGWEKKYPNNPLLSLKNKVDLVISLNASHFTKNKMEQRIKLLKKTSQFLNSPILYTNNVGVQDEVIFDGNSLAMDEKGRILTELRAFKEKMILGDLNTKKEKLLKLESSEKRTREALVFGIKSFVEKAGFKKVHFGLSGGIDSALVACLCVEALGNKKVQAVLLPGPYTSKHSIEDAKLIAKKLKIKLHTYSINPLYQMIEKTFMKKLNDLSKQNIQSRLRALKLMLFSSEKKSLLVNTSNKSEIAVGYGSLYGDMIGAFSPLGDLLKTEVYSISKFYKSQIPRRVFLKEPSAELKKDQTDSKELIAYDLLDPLIEKLIEKNEKPVNAVERKWLQKIDQNEFKRRQFPPILQLSDQSFGLYRRCPIN